ncbi:MAG: phosphotransferase [Dehalococcoidia bacterium]|nr:phosphotransferase [Dehalococcoidia bacterium]
MTTTYAIPRGTADIDATWLNHVLAPELRGGASITGFTRQIIGEGVGFVGEVARLSLEYDAPAPGALSSVIAKVPITNEGFRKLGMELGVYRKEHGFYTAVAPTTPVRVPGCYYAGADDERGEYALLLEDLDGMRAGDQLASCSFEEAETALREVAKLHARWWDSPDLDSVSAWVPGHGDAYFDLLEALFERCLPLFPEVYRDMVTPEVIAIAERLDGRYMEMIRVIEGEHRTFLHGDFRLDNMFFGSGPGTPPLVLLDWQIPFRSNALWDVVYFLGGNFEPEWRRANQDALLAAYHEALVAAGVPNYTFAQCQEDYRRAALVLIAYMVNGAGDVDVTTFNERGQQLFETMFRRYSTTIVDLNCIEFMPPR